MESKIQLSVMKKKRAIVDGQIKDVLEHAKVFKSFHRMFVSLTLYSHSMRHLC